MGNVIFIGNVVKQPRKTKEPIVIDMRAYRMNKLRKTILDKHRKDKGE